ncbi:MAG TPA: Hsp20/alpha crystallin family protein [Gammaproteobacteria bacterium]
MNVIRYNPWSLLDRLSRDADSVFGRLPVSAEGDEPYAVNDWLPAIDIREEDDRYLLHADVPGVSAEDINVTLDNGVLTLTGQRETQSESDRDGLRRAERVSGRFFRRFSLPDTADSTAVSADYRNGVLEVSIPKQPATQPRRIEVKVN